MTMAPLWTLVLMILPFLASSFPQGQDIGVCCNTKKRNFSREKSGFFDTGKDSQVQEAGDEEEDQKWNYQPVKSHLPLFPVLQGYVCCNQPATRPPGRRNGWKRNQGYALTKRDDDYSDLHKMIAKIIRRLAESADRQDSQLPESADRPDISHVAESLDRLDDSVVVPSLPTTSDDDNHIRSILGDWELEDNDLASSGFKKRFSGSGAGGMNMGG
ncbi:uncharacterized protein LOC112565174 isoform X2 [Pomacea canaliculata]|uniref:uncharacterized protein LOC112565174 isoform X2 n=1 Tax=Pomacea canaliculata TaxID=400727 RepID=UPI000D73A204|nr:uncharacterized protein LOC112565174 isoform X2 [Pomacea canaliculata]